MPKGDVKFKVSKELNDKILQLVETARNTGKIRKGMNETTKAVERGIAKLAVIAGDVEPEEIVMHLPVLCDEKKIPYVYTSSKVELGRSAGIDVASAAICIIDPGEGKDALKEVLQKIEEIKK